MLAVILVLVGLGSEPRTAIAHDVPDQIPVTGFITIDESELHLLVRVPLVMLTSMNLPKWGPGYLQLDAIDPLSERLIGAVDNHVRLREDGRSLDAGDARYRISLPSEDAFRDYESARAHVTGPSLPDDARVFWNQGYLDTYLRYPIRSSASTFSLDFAPGVGLRGRLKMALLFRPFDGDAVAYSVHGNSGEITLNPGWHHAAAQFVVQGFHHILDGTDHLLFLLCLIVPFRLGAFRALVAVITSFTVAHSVTLIAAALGYVPSGDWFIPLVELLIAISILYMAMENVVAVWWRTSEGLILGWRWIVTGVFGLVHGFGFSFVLREELQFAGPHVLTSLLAFNVGVELGQLLVLAILLPAVTWLFRSQQAHTLCIIATSVLVGHTAWHWTEERADALRYVQWPSPAEAPLLLLAGTALLVAGAIWLRARLAGARGDAG